MTLRGRRALVTGGTGAIGSACAVAMANAGAAVVVHGRNAARAQAVVSKIADAGGIAHAVLGDLKREVDRVVSDAEAAVAGEIDLLVNAAGGSGAKSPWDESDPATWADLYEENVLVVVRLIQRVLPGMRRAKFGRVVNISSGAGVMPPPTGANYAAAKAALNNLGVSLSKAVAAEGITVNTVSPGTILTDALERAFRAIARDQHLADPDGPWDAVELAVLPKVVSVPAGRVGRPEDIAAAVAFLCSPQAGYITGVNLRIDGGAVPTV